MTESVILIVWLAFNFLSLCSSRLFQGAEIIFQFITDNECFDNTAYASGQYKNEYVTIKNTDLKKCCHFV